MLQAGRDQLGEGGIPELFLSCAFCSSGVLFLLAKGLATFF